MKFIRVKNGTLKERPRRTKDLEADIKILDLKNEYALQNITLKEYILSLAATCKDLSKNS